MLKRINNQAFQLPKLSANRTPQTLSQERILIEVKNLLSDPIFLTALASSRQAQFTTFSPSQGPFKNYTIYIVRKPWGIHNRTYNVFDQTNHRTGAGKSRKEKSSQEAKSDSKPSGQQSTRPNKPAAQTTPYEVLGLTPSATNTEIRKKFLNLAKQYHPDKNKAPDAEENFKRIKNAYDQIAKDRNIS